MLRFHTLRALPLILGAILCLSGCSGDRSSDLGEFLTGYLKAHPKADVQDVYKLLFQGVFGVGHIITSQQEAAQFLAREMASMPARSGEPMTEPCRPDGGMLRVNLRPFRDAAMNTDDLIAAMMETAASVKAAPEEFASLWSAVGDLIEDGVLPLDLDEYNALTDDLLEQNWPAVHHSDDYSHAYAPAYRVVSREAWERHFAK